MRKPGALGMKILFVGPYHLPKGFGSLKMITYVFQDLYNAVEGACDRVYLLTARDLPEYIEEALGSFEKLNVIPAVNYGFGLRGTLRRHAKLILRGIRLVKGEGIDVVTNMSSEFVYGFDAALIARLTGRRMVLRVPGDLVTNSAYMGRYRSWRILFKPLDLLRRRLAYQWADRIIVMSQREKARAARIAGSTQKIFICPRGIDTEKFSPSGETGAERKPMKVLFVGRKSKEKGYDLLIEAARLLRNVPGVRFEFVGDFPIGEEGNITYRGKVNPSELPNVYAGADLVVLPSRNDGLPQVLVEAMSMGRATILTSHVFKDIVSQDTALFCSADPKDIADKILWLHDNPTEIKRLGMAAREYAVRNFAKDRFARLYLDILSGELSK